MRKVSKFTQARIQQQLQPSCEAPRESTQPHSIANCCMSTPWLGKHRQRGITCSPRESRRASLTSQDSASPRRSRGEPGRAIHKPRAAQPQHGGKSNSRAGQQLAGQVQQGRWGAASVQQSPSRSPGTRGNQAQLGPSCRAAASQHNTDKGWGPPAELK